ncbi:hypothetical protein [Arcticibacter sp. MXS-1]|uniref:hypothetical protein n=1 Tax=Arcticibacter sp. MXS-1 TaxID=3341726 RepID=UPI0035A85EEE
MLQNIYSRAASAVSSSINTALSIIKILLQAKPGLTLPASTKKECYILGNGPSLAESLRSHSDLLSQSELYVVNGFAISEYYVRLRPANYVFLDQYFTGYDGQNTPIPTVKQTFEHMIADTSWPLTLFVPASTRANPFWKELQSKNRNIRVAFFNYVVFKGSSSIAHWFFRHNLAMPQCQNILAASIYLTINRHYEKVFLLGADHSWHEQLIVDENNTVATLDKHFYNTGGTQVNLKQRAIKADSYGVHAYFASLAKAFYSYVVLSRYAKSQKVAIYNASSKTYIDAFERVTLPKAERD